MNTFPTRIPQAWLAFMLGAAHFHCALDTASSPGSADRRTCG